MPVKLAAQCHEPQSDAGNNPALVILHGLFGSASNWRSLSRQLGEVHPVHVLDLRNHGVSPHHPSMTYPDLASDVLEYLDDKVDGPVVIIGHSMGGKAAMHLALSQGQRLVGLIVVDIAPVINQHDFDNLFEAMTELDTSSIQRRSEAEEALGRRVPEQALRQFLLQNLVRADTGYRWRINLQAIASNMDAILDFPLPDQWQPFQGPTLFIRGEQSTYICDEHETVIHELFPNARLVTIKNAGHWLHAEQPQRFFKEVGGFLESLSRCPI